MGTAIPPYQARRALRSVFAKRSEPVFGMIEENVSTSPFFVGIRPIFMIKYYGMKNYSGKKILILGLAREGTDSLRYFLEKYPAVQIAAADRAEIEKLGPAARGLLAENPQSLSVMVSLSMCGSEIYLEDTLYRKTACVVLADFAPTLPQLWRWLRTTSADAPASASNRFDTQLWGCACN